MSASPDIRRPATYQDLLDAPEHRFAQLIGGTLYLTSRPPLHQLAVTRLLAKLYPFEGGWSDPEGWTIVHGPDLHFGQDVLVPDHAGWRNARVPDFSETWAELKIPPDWVCEVLSSETRVLDLTEKRDLYGANGVGHLWFIAPWPGRSKPSRCARARGGSSPPSRTQTRCASPPSTPWAFPCRRSGPTDRAFPHSAGSRATDRIWGNGAPDGRLRGPAVSRRPPPPPPRCAGRCGLRTCHLQARQREFPTQPGFA